MSRPNRILPDTFTPALEAIANLALDDLNRIFVGAQMAAVTAHAEIEMASVNQKTGHFYRHLMPLRKDLVSLLADSYRRFFKLALANPSQTGGDPGTWAWTQLQPAIVTAVEWIREWYILACDGPSPVASFSPPTSWHAPVWLFGISIASVGVGPLKQKHIPNADSENKLGKAHTRLLLKGARRVFLWDLGEAIERVRNEETAAGGAIRAEAVSGQKRRTTKRKGWEQRLKLYNVIRTILSANPSLQGMKFCAELDKRHAPPLLDWIKSGEWRKDLTWKEAWGNTNLRRKIRRVRQEAQKATL